MSTQYAAPAPARGSFAPGFERVAEVFAEQLRSGAQLGAGFAATVDGELAVDLWGGRAHPGSELPWRRDTACVVFSVTKGLTAMALHLLAERGAFEWDAPVARYWPEFAQGGKGELTVRTLFNHRGGLPVLDERFRLEDCVDPAQRGRLTAALERQRPLWAPEQGQGYHAITFGMYAREFIERLAGESAGTLLRRELFAPLDAEVWVGAPPEVHARLATLVSPNPAERVVRMAGRALEGGNPEGRMLLANLRGDRLSTRSFLNPSLGRLGPARYGLPDVTASELLWASGVATARGVARAYLPFALGGVVGGRRYFSAESVGPLERRQGWSSMDRVLCKPLGWSQGFLKEEPEVVAAGERSFGHFGLGGALGWCDPEARVTVGYVLNKLDWHVRSPRSMALCRALYEAPPLRERRASRAAG